MSLVRKTYRLQYAAVNPHRALCFGLDCPRRQRGHGADGGAKRCSLRFLRDRPNLKSLRAPTEAGPGRASRRRANPPPELFAKDAILRERAFSDPHSLLYSTKRPSGTASEMSASRSARSISDRCFAPNGRNVIRRLAPPRLPAKMPPRNSAGRYGLIPMWPLSRAFVQLARNASVPEPPSQDGDTGSNPAGTTNQRDISEIPDETVPLDRRTIALGGLLIGSSTPPRIDTAGHRPQPVSTFKPPAMPLDS